MKRFTLIVAAVILIAAVAGITGIFAPDEAVPAVVFSPLPTAAATPEVSPPPLLLAPPPAPSPKPTPTPPVTIIVAGDVLTGERIGPKIEAGKYDEVLDEASAERFRAADIAVINLETSVSDRGEPVPNKQYTFCSPPENLAFLRDYLGIDAAGLANNHTRDYGDDALLDTFENVREYGITPFGAGENLEAAAEPYIAEVNGKTIAFFAANQIVPTASWLALENRAGQLSWYEPSHLDLLKENIKTARETCDYIIVYMHWGIERDLTPNNLQEFTAHYLIDIGVDVVIGAHPHVIQNFEYYHGKPIIYSLGNFIFNNRNPETAFAEITIEDGNVTVKLIPCKMSGTKTYAVEESEARALLVKWDANSVNATLDNDGYLKPADRPKKIPEEEEVVPTEDVVPVEDVVSVEE
ncbi:MAG: CapA family protein [Oscillospiraceae bacterium]|jgi:poly-gamma-glutamate synthesis protein (capsule biosynthesis protein)|nr:CapA family protein [Oscillospiraceae bacterium]